MTATIERMIERAVGVRPARLQPMSGGCVAQVVRADLPGGDRVVAKIDPAGSGGLESEAFMLRYLKERTGLPVPCVRSASATLLVMDFVEGSTGMAGRAQEHAAELLADLHSNTDAQFGFEKDTVIGGLAQPNPRSEKWIEFFRDQRLLFMANHAAKEGRLPHDVHSRVRSFADRLDELLVEPAAPSLIHGDVWSGNVLSSGDRITGFLDPAIYFAHPEIELAFITLFSTAGDRFFEVYHERHPRVDGFVDARRLIYNLYPLLVHVRLFGGHYVESVDATLRRFGA